MSKSIERPGADEKPVEINANVLDLRGLNCPYPVLRAARVLKGMAAGERIVLECTDPMTKIDVPHFTNQSGHLLVRHWQEGPIFSFEIECRALTPSPSP